MFQTLFLSRVDIILCVIFVRIVTNTRVGTLFKCACNTSRFLLKFINARVIRNFSYATSINNLIKTRLMTIINTCDVLVLKKHCCLLLSGNKIVISDARWRFHRLNVCFDRSYKCHTEPQPMASNICLWPFRRVTPVINLCNK